MEHLLMFGCRCLLCKQMFEYHLKNGSCLQTNSIRYILCSHLSRCFSNTVPSQFGSIDEWRQPTGQTREFDSTDIFLDLLWCHHQLQRPLLFCGSVAARRPAGNSLEQRREKWVRQLRLSVIQPQAEKTGRGSIATVFPGPWSTLLDT